MQIFSRVGIIVKLLNYAFISPRIFQILTENYDCRCLFNAFSCPHEILVNNKKVSSWREDVHKKWKLHFTAQAHWPFFWYQKRRFACPPPPMKSLNRCRYEIFVNRSKAPQGFRSIHTFAQKRCDRDRTWIFIYKQGWFQIGYQIWKWLERLADVLWVI